MIEVKSATVVINGIEYLLDLDAMVIRKVEHVDVSRLPTYKAKEIIHNQVIAEMYETCEGMFEYEHYIRRLESVSVRMGWVKMTMSVKGVANLLRKRNLDDTFKFTFTNIEKDFCYIKTRLLGNN